MKKSILLFFAAGSILASCGGASSEEAAKELCNCYEKVVEETDAMGEATSSTEMFEAAARIKDLAAEGDECQKKWSEKYNGNIDIESFKTELKKQNEKIYELMDKKGLF